MSGVYYKDLFSAYTATTVNTTIAAQMVTFTGNQTFDKAVRINLKGGFDADYTHQTGTTSIKGTVTIKKGIVIFDGLVIR